MKKVEKYTVLPKIPDQLSQLLTIAYNLWWCWNPKAIGLFQMMDPDLWTQVSQNPIKMLASMDYDRLEALSSDEVFTSYMQQVYSDLIKYLAHETWFKRKHADYCGSTIAYFSAEFGFHESVPLYSGGLGILAGDHLKSASDLGLPLMGISLLYRQGYFRQYLNQDGWQMERYDTNDFLNMPLSLIRNPDETPLLVKIDLPGRALFASIWRVQVGRSYLYLLDTDIPENSTDDRVITRQLYGGDLEMRMKQEILLGMGGIKALNLMGVPPSICHLNEGHSAFLALERIRTLMKKTGLSFQVASEFVRFTNNFTTHTPVPAGIDQFPGEMVKKYFNDYCREVGISIEELMALGQEKGSEHKDTFSMAILAINLSAYTNGVSKLHSQVSRNMWQSLYPQIPESEVPISHVTNGIHTQTWYSDEMARLFSRYLGSRWLDDPTDHSMWERVERLPYTELWRGRERLRERLVTFARQRLQQQLTARGVNRIKIDRASQVLNPEALTIGFARRFATYKRAYLLFKDPNRLRKLLSDPKRPVQIILAGKAHPKDNPGKEVIKYIVKIAESEEFRQHILFIEDYDFNVARYLVQGVDIWLNTPRRPMEASGTSGMKVVANGGINFSILDGWWCEAYNSHNGWAIGSGEELIDEDYQDQIESKALYDIMENELIPQFYDRGRDGIPRRWLNKIRESMKSICPVFNTSRMVEEYTEKFYLNQLKNHRIFSDDNYQVSNQVFKDKLRLLENWSQVKITEAKASEKEQFYTGDILTINAQLFLGQLQPDDVKVEIYFGTMDEAGEIVKGDKVTMECQNPDQKGDNHDQYSYKGQIYCAQSGEYGFTIRVLPIIQNVDNTFSLKLINWWEG